MKKILKYIIPVLILAGAAAGHQLLAGMAAPPKEVTPPVRILNIEIMEAKAETINMSVTAYGVVKPDEETKLVAEVSGRVIRISPKFEIGGVFKKGELMLAVDPIDYDAAEARAAYNLAQAGRLLKMEKLRVKQARKDWAIVGKGAPTEVVLRKPQLDEVKAQYNYARAALAKAGKDKKRTIIYAPFNCIVTAKSISSGGFLNQGSSFATIAGLNAAEIRLKISTDKAALIDLPRTDLVQGEKKTPVIIKSALEDNPVEFEGEIVRTEGTVDLKTRQICIVARVKDPYGIESGSRQLMFGSFVKAEIVGKKMTGVFSVPSRLAPEDGRVWLVNNDNKLELRKTQIISREKNRVIIGAGLSEGDRLSLTRFDGSMQGKPVNVKASPGAGRVAVPGKDERNG